jgi:putative ABC transport system substrate-binding protein
VVTRRTFLTTLTGGLLAAPLAAEAQQPERVARIGLLRTGAPPDPALDAFKDGLRELGYVEGQHVTFDVRFAAGQLDRLPSLAAELIQRNVDVVVTGGEAAIQAAKVATRTIPIVMGASNDPVSAGLVDSLARPGGNITGSTILAPELSRKRLALLRELSPTITRVAVLSDPTSPGAKRDLEETQRAARALSFKLRVWAVRTPRDLDEAFAGMRRDGADAVMTLADPVFTAWRVRIVRLAAATRLPGIYYWKDFVDAGGLMSYGPSLHALYRRAALYVDKILKGAHPSDLPVEQPTQFELVINLKTATALGLTIPPSLLQRADQVIE